MVLGGCVGCITWVEVASGCRQQRMSGEDVTLEVAIRLRGYLGSMCTEIYSARLITE